MLPVSTARAEGAVMKWVTGARPKADRIACPWEADDQVLLARGTFVYDALSAWCARKVAAPAGAAG